jgi:hypothetical protein
MFSKEKKLLLLEDMIVPQKKRFKLLLRAI